MGVGHTDGLQFRDELAGALVGIEAREGATRVVRRRP